jgi:NADH-quinone oxidoreductase subunit M
MLPIVPDAISEYGCWAITLSVAGVVYGAFIAWRQNDFKRLIAYSSISHVGMIAAGVFSMTTEGLTGAMLQMLSHGVNVVGLFFVADILMQRTKTRELTLLGGIRTVAPAFATAFIIVLLASVALPGTNGFVGEFMLLTGIFRYDAWLAALAGLSVIMGAVYMLRAYRKSMLGELSVSAQGFTDLSWNEKAVLYPIAALIFLFGVYPDPLIHLVEPSVRSFQELLTGTGAVMPR